eukprot:CAMPEP_0175966032 /NCGR_PEP_ID=MMETSP0108-20121206/38443_1 /TAXON_ID=195067 ORGANISM="Goniomonas pacifica, Strain CCMP1869" /NCGR_SAMPLE_ID=MMETSP0108 /ASSEMBLY_ACC=CAM_ASM_000204 /LENGTH=140 /DNA_ID=CAMNT_0017294183 /DNA_START=351 /DNA_END=773 /DNA_ORIENTATION=-
MVKSGKGWSNDPMRVAVGRGHPAGAGRGDVDHTAGSDDGSSASVLSDLWLVGNGNPVKLSAFVRACEAAVGKTAQINEVEPLKGDVPHTFADVSKAAKWFGYHPSTSVEEGLKAMYADITNNGERDKLALGHPDEIARLG